MRGFSLLPLLLTGCAPPNREPPVHGAGSCDAARAQALVGQAATAELAGRARDLAGARIVRWLQPGMMVTMEFRGDRLNIEIDESGTVKSIRCG